MADDRKPTIHVIGPGEVSMRAGASLEVPWTARVSLRRTKHDGSLCENSGWSEWLQFFIQKHFKNRGGIPPEHNNIRRLTKEIEKVRDNSPEFSGNVWNEYLDTEEKRKIWRHAVAAALKKILR
jgi:hypothetical protein